MNYFSRLILFCLFTTPLTLYSQVDSITITHHWEYYDGDTSIENIVDSFSTGIHVSEFVYASNNSPLKRTNYTWGQQGLIDSTIETYYNGSWVNFHQTSNQYYANDSLHISTKYFYINNSGVFDTNATRITITFDSITNTKIVLQEAINYNSPWSIIGRINYTYDSQHRITYQLSEFGVNLEPSSDQYNYYLPNDSIDYSIYHTYQSGVVYTTDSITNLYNANYYLLERTTYNIWNINQWRPGQMRSYTYDANDNMLSSCGHLWLQGIGWYYFSDTTWSTYNLNNQIVESETRYDGGGGNHSWCYYDASNRIDSVHWMTWPHGGDTHNHYYKMEYPLVNSVKNIVAEQDLQLYPNPSTGIFTVESDEFIHSICVYDLNGKIVYNKEIDSTDFNFDLGKFPSGIYFLKMNEDSRILWKKILVN